jgi:hypothetical protein
MSQGTPNIRVGLEVHIFGTTQMDRAKKALKELGLSIENVDTGLANVNGNQTRYHRGLVTLTAKTKESREEQAKAAKAAIETATANAEVASQVKKTTDAVTQITSGLKKQQTQNEKTQQAATNLANHTAKVTATANAKVTENREKTNNALRLLDEKDFNSYREHIRKIVSERLRSNNKIAQDGARSQNSLTLVRTREEEKRETQHRNHLNRIEAMERNHQLTLQRMQQGGGIGGIFGGIGNVGRVIAYDMLRRTITNIYQAAWRVAEALGQWTIESINFNDELARAQTVFTGLGMIGTRNNEGGPMTIPQAEVSSDPKVQEVLRKAQEGSDKMMRGLIEITALTGSDMDEVVSSARQILPDLINKRSKAGMPNPYLQNPDELNMITQQMVKLASVLKMSDPGGRPLKWHMVAIQELFSGTSGGDKDKGREAVRSLRAREGIKMSDEEASTLAKAVNTGDLVRASQIIEATLERSGQGLQNLSNLLAKTLKPNVDGTVTALRLFGQKFTEILHKDLIADFTAMRVSLFDILEDPRFKTAMTALSGMFAESFKDIRDIVFRYLDMIHEDPQAALKKLEPIVTNFRQGITALGYAIEAVGLFLMGFFGTDLGMKNLADSFKELRDGAYQNGAQMATTISSINAFTNSLVPVANMITTVMPLFNQIFGYLLVGFTAVFDLIESSLRNVLRFVPDFLLPEAIARFKNETTEESGQFRILGSNFNFARTMDLIDRINESSGLFNGQRPPFPQNLPIPPQPVPSPAGVLGAAVPSAAGMVAGQPAGGGGGGGRMAPVDFNNQLNNPNIKLSDNAVVEGLKAAKPMRFEPRRVEQTVNVNIGTMNVTASDAQGLVDQLSNIQKGNAPTPSQKFRGPLTPDAAAARGLSY